MNTEPWRTVMVESASDICISNGNLKAGDTIIPIDQIKQVVVGSPRGSISLPAVNSLIKHNASIILCGDKCLPLCELSPYGTHFERAGNLMDQSSWTDRRKDAVWRQIVTQKVSNQVRLLEMLGIAVPDKLYGYSSSVRHGDNDNREAAVARLYFDELFGADFVRFKEDSTNAALNYGYTILRSSFDRAIAIHGYRSELGIHHCSRQNPFNLSCDLMEPFRPFVDEVVYRNPGRELDYEYRREFISLTESMCRLDGNKVSIGTAIDMYTLDVIKKMSEPRSIIGKVEFYE